MLYKAKEQDPAPNSENVMAAFAQAASSVWGVAGGEVPSYLPPGNDNTVCVCVCVCVRACVNVLMCALKCSSPKDGC